MRPIPTAFLALALTACTTTGSGNDSSPLPGTGLSGSTGQSGTSPLTCGERIGLDPIDQPVTWDEQTDLGFSIAEGLAPVLSTSATLTWAADGATTGLTGTLDADANTVNGSYDPATGTLTACVGLTLQSDDGRFLGGWVANRVQLDGLGLVSAVHESTTMVEGGRDTDDPLRTRLELVLDGGQTTGTYSEAPLQGTPPGWSVVASW